MPDKPLLSILLPIDLTNGNRGRTKHFGASAKRRREYETLIVAKGLLRTPFEHPVNVSVTRILGKGQRMFDSSSLGRGNYKELEDALVACGWFHDDGPKWVKNTLFFQADNRRDIGPAVLIEIEVAE